MTLFILGSACPVTHCLHAVMEVNEVVDMDVNFPGEKQEVEDDYDKLLFCYQNASACLINARKWVQVNSFLVGIPPVIPIISPPPETTV